MQNKPNPFKGALVALLFLMVATGCGKQPGNSGNPGSESPLKHWERFTSEAGKFSILFPGTPEEKQQTSQSQFGKIEMHAFAAKKDTQNAYGVGYFDIPKVPDIKSYLDKVQALEAGAQGKIVSQKEIQMGNNSGREFEFIKGGKANYSVRARMIMVGQRL